MNTPIDWTLPVVNGYNHVFKLLSLEGPTPGYPVVGCFPETGQTTIEIFSLEGTPKHRYTTKEDLRNASLRITGWLLLRKDQQPKLLEDFPDSEMARGTMEHLAKQNDFIALKRIDLEVAVGTNDFSEMYPTPLQEIVEEFREVGNHPTLDRIDILQTGISADGGAVSVRIDTKL